MQISAANCEACWPPAPWKGISAERAAGLSSGTGSSEARAKLGSQVREHGREHLFEIAPGSPNNRWYWIPHRSSCIPLRCSFNSNLRAVRLRSRTAWPNRRSKSAHSIVPFSGNDYKQVVPAVHFEAMSKGQPSPRRTEVATPPTSSTQACALLCSWRCVNMQIRQSNSSVHLQATVQSGRSSKA